LVDQAYRKGLNTHDDVSDSKENLDEKTDLNTNIELWGRKMKPSNE